MAILRVKLHGEVLSTLHLESGREYLAGRANDVQIHLNQQRGISRHHLKFFERDGVWVCESLSKFVQIQRGQESMPVLELTESCVFTVSSFEFEFEHQPQTSAEPNHDGSREVRNPPAFYVPHPQTATKGDEQTSPRANNEATVAGQGSFMPYIRISFPDTADDEVLKLEGQLWTAGRDSNCEIPIDSAHVSRKHFELTRTSNGYFVTDLGSSNGTKINGQKIPAHEPTQLISGDEIQIQNIVMTFEIRDTQFPQKVDHFPSLHVDAAMAGEGLPWGEYAQHPVVYDPTVYRSSEPVGDSAQGWRRLLKKQNKPNRVRMALYVLIPLVLVVALLPDKKKEEDGARTPAGGDKSQQSVTFEALTKEKKMMVKDAFNLASSLYTSGKYSLCLTELAKVHEIVPQYANSKELQSFCEQGMELQRRAEDVERQRREKERIENQVVGYVENCKNTLKANASVDDTRTCLAPAIELAPDHNLVVELLHTAQMREEEKKFMAEEKAKETARMAKGQAHFQHAMDTYKQGKLAKSIGELEKFVAGNYPQVAELKERARRQIASIKAELKVKVGSYIEKCKSLGAKSAWREAYLACDQAVSEDSGNGEAKEMRSRMLSELRREMKSIYEDSVLEESMGNVDTAKEKWKKIMQDDLPDDDYSRKAKSKLQKYGIGN